MTGDSDPKHERPAEPTVGVYDEDEEGLDAVGSSVRERRKLERRLFHVAHEALAAATKATEAIDRHIEECARNYRDMAFVMKWVIGILGAGTLLIITALGAVAWALFEYILGNPRLLGP